MTGPDALIQDFYASECANAVRSMLFQETLSFSPVHLLGPGPGKSSIESSWPVVTGAPDGRHSHGVRRADHCSICGPESVLGRQVAGQEVPAG